mmetsp:Transcript_27856/g.73080  ORF Transcript_27856/g.73080 Transcript_27856/m.73080 type:complete len:522 (-) Transcript_27856:106-1671(-)
MGAYLSKPKTAKISSDHEGMGLKVGVSEMQGWRVSMEDAHCIDLALADRIALVGVLDGHGGGEVARFVATRFPEVLKEQSDFKKALGSPPADVPALLSSALAAAFLDMDRALLLPENIEVMAKLAGDPLADSDSDSADDNEAATLANDATIPIEMLIAEYLKREQAEEGGAIAAAAAVADDSDAAIASGKPSLLAALLHGDPILLGDDDESDSENGDDTINSGTLSGKDDGKGTAADSGANQSKRSGDAHKYESAPKRPRVEEKETRREVVAGAEPTLGEADQEGGHASTKDGTADDGPAKELAPPAGNSDDSDEDDDDEKDDTDDVAECVGVTSGTTAVFALVYTVDKLRVVVVANAGDSRAVLCRGRDCIDLSFDHKPEDAKEKGRVEAAGGRVDDDGRINGGLNLSRALGDHQYKRNAKLPPTAQLISPEPDITVTILQPEDKFLVLACDGIWNSLSSEEVVCFVDDYFEGGCDAPGEAGAVPALSTVCEELCDACMSDDLSGDGSGLDNETAMVVAL